MSKSASIWSRLAIFRLPRSAEKGQHFQTGGKKKTGAKAQPRYNGFRVISDRVITALQCTSKKLQILTPLCNPCIGLSGSVGCASDWRPGGCRFESRRGRQHSFMEIDHEIFFTVILSLPLIQEAQLSVFGERMCTILVNRLED